MLIESNPQEEIIAQDYETVVTAHQLRMTKKINEKEAEVLMVVATRETVSTLITMAKGFIFLISNADDERDNSKSPKRHTRRSLPRARSPPRGPRSMQEHDRTTREHTDPSLQTKPVGDTDDSMEVDRVSADFDGDEVAREMLRVMGFVKFKSTKQTPVAGNKGAYGVSIDKKTRYRQYMNRKGGFNRPLSPS